MTVSVVKPFGKDDVGLTIYYRANLRTLHSFLTPEESKVCVADFESLKAEGMHAYGIANHVVEPEDALEFLRIVNENLNANRINNQNDKFLLNLAKDLEFIGVFCL